MESCPIRARLALMMFGQYVVLGAWVVPLATYLLARPDDGGLGFTPAQTAWIYSTTALVGLFSSLLLGLLADRLFAAQRLLGVLHLAGAGILFAAGRFCSAQQEALRSGDAPGSAFPVLMALMVANAFVTMLTLALCNVTGFRNLREPKKSFGSVRMYGTLGWIAVNLGIDLFGTAVSAQPLFVAAAESAVMGLYCFTLPHTPPSRVGHGWSEAIGLPALKMFRDPGFRVLIASALCMSAVQQFFTVYANPYLRELGAAKPMALQTLAQVSEVVCLAALPVVLARLGFKVTLALAVLGWVVRNAIFATGSLPFIALVGLPLHGVCFTFFFVVTNVYVDRHAPSHLRASAQGILAFTASGVGVLLGNFVSARALEMSRADAGTSWAGFWLVPAAVAGVVFLLFVTCCRETAPVAVEPARTGSPRAEPVAAS